MHLNQSSEIAQPLIESEADWNALRENLLDNARLFADRVEQLTDKQLNGVFVDEKYGTSRRNIEGVLEHSYYHLGQISLIVKLLDER